jgi:hypothetical protein
VGCTEAKPARALRLASRRKMRESQDEPKTKDGKETRNEPLDEVTLSWVPQAMELQERRAELVGFRLEQ